jgi:hypothetical protein
MSKDTQPQVEDFLDEDAEIPGQKYVLLSFLSPEKVLQRKDLFFFERFLKSYEVDWRVKNLEKFLADSVLSINKQLDDSISQLEKDGQAEQAELCRKNVLKVEDVLNNYQEFVKKNQQTITQTKIKEAWDDFMFKEQTKLEDEFYQKNDFQTSMRGVKVRGVWPSSKEAELRAKKLQQKDKYFNIFIGEIGKWLPWDPSPHQVGEQEYAESELNNLMKSYKENEDARDKFFEEQKKQPAPKKVVFGVEDGNDAAAVSSSSSGSGSGSSEFSGLFNGSGDLALSRKMEREANLKTNE